MDVKVVVVDIPIKLLDHRSSTNEYADDWKYLLDLIGIKLNTSNVIVPYTNLSSI